MVSLWQIWTWIIFGLVMAASAFCLVVGIVDFRSGPAVLGAVGLFGCLTVALQIRTLAHLRRIDHRESGKGD